MPVEVVIPSLGLTMEEGTVAEWLKQEGDPVAKDEPLFVLETDKASLEVAAPQSGTLARILVPAGTSVPVGAPVAFIALPDEATAEGAPAPGPAAPADAGPSPAPAAVPAVDPARVAAASGHGGRLLISPAARRLARELGVDPTPVCGTGPNGRIVERDIRGAAAAATAAATATAPAASSAPAPGAGARSAAVPANRYRRVTAARLAEAHRSVPAVTLFMSVQMDEAVRLYEQLREHYQREYGIRLTWDALVVKAVAVALRAAPYANARWADDGIQPLDSVHVGFAVSLEDGLVVPVVRDADRKSLKEIAADVVRLAGAARQGRLQPAEMGGASFSITNLGRYDVLAFTPIINPPESGILGVGQITESYGMAGGQLTLRRSMIISLVFDHRLMDGAPAAQFQQQIKRALEQPYRLLLADQP